MSIECDPRYGPALAWAAVCHHRLRLLGSIEDREGDRLKGTAFARRALEVAGDDPVIIANAAFALGFFGEDIGAMIALVDRALALNSSYARGWHLSGNLRVYAGQLEIALEHLETAIRLSPRARVGTSLGQIGLAHFFCRRFDQALPKLLIASQEDPSHPQTLRYLAACYAQLGRVAEARDVVKQLLSLTQVVVSDLGYFRNPEHRELLLSGLRLAAGGET